MAFVDDYGRSTKKGVGRVRATQGLTVRAVLHVARLPHVLFQAIS